MGKNKKAFVPPLKSKREKNSNAPLMEKPSVETENLVVRNPTLEKPTANISSSLIINVVPNSDDTTDELVAGPAADNHLESSLSGHDGIFLRDESQKAPDDVYEFQSSPVNLLTAKNGGTVQDCPKQDQNCKRSMKKKKTSSVRQSVLKDIAKMQKAMSLLREREQSLMASSEQ
ncbi:uncharacterized protein LOC117295115 [Asterias rubens]|uniref:uncharacterized protein LOC117295115 n=1 Tax=Asterias rubens TaxID=7604 RepID=UPI001455C090|nr:uncharacterized protein LOC117295115 [Asterias rubens]